MELFFSDVKNDTEHVLVNTVIINKGKYTVDLYTDAHKAWLSQNILGRHSTSTIILIIYTKFLFLTASLQKPALCMQRR